MEKSSPIVYAILCLDWESYCLTACKENHDAGLAFEALIMDSGSGVSFLQDGWI